MVSLSKESETVRKPLGPLGWVWHWFREPKTVQDSQTFVVVLEARELGWREVTALLT